MFRQELIWTREKLDQEIKKLSKSLEETQTKIDEFTENYHTTKAKAEIKKLSEINFEIANTYTTYAAGLKGDASIPYLQQANEHFTSGLQELKNIKQQADFNIHFQHLEVLFSLIKRNTKSSDNYLAQINDLHPQHLILTRLQILKQRKDIGPYVEESLYAIYKLAQEEMARKSKAKQTLDDEKLEFAKEEMTRESKQVKRTLDDKEKEFPPNKRLRTLTEANKDPMKCSDLSTSLKDSQESLSTLADPAFAGLSFGFFTTSANPDDTNEIVINMDSSFEEESKDQSADEIEIESDELTPDEDSDPIAYTYPK